MFFSSLSKEEAVFTQKQLDFIRMRSLEMYRGEKQVFLGKTYEELFSIHSLRSKERWEKINRLYCEEKEKNNRAKNNILEMVELEKKETFERFENFYNQKTSGLENKLGEENNLKKLFSFIDKSLKFQIDMNQENSRNYWRMTWEIFGSLSAIERNNRFFVWLSEQEDKRFTVEKNIIFSNLKNESTFFSFVEMPRSFYDIVFKER